MGERGFHVTVHVEFGDDGEMVVHSPREEGGGVEVGGVSPVVSQHVQSGRQSQPRRHPAGKGRQRRQLQEAVDLREDLRAERGVSRGAEEDATAGVADERFESGEVEEVGGISRDYGGESQFPREEQVSERFKEGRGRERVESLFLRGAVHLHSFTYGRNALADGGSGLHEKDLSACCLQRGRHGLQRRRQHRVCARAARGGCAQHMVQQSPVPRESTLRHLRQPRLCRQRGKRLLVVRQRHVTDTIPAETQKVGSHVHHRNAHTRAVAPLRQCRKTHADRLHRAAQHSRGYSLHRQVQHVRHHRTLREPRESNLPAGTCGTSQGPPPPRNSRSAAPPDRLPRGTSREEASLCRRGCTKRRDFRRRGSRRGSGSRDTRNTAECPGGGLRAAAAVEEGNKETYGVCEGGQHDAHSGRQLVVAA